MSGAGAAVALRSMTADDVPAAQALTASFGWPHRREDWAFMQALGHGIVADRAGQPVGTALCWRYGADRGTLGLIAVSQALHGQGIGRRMMEALCLSAEGRSLSLHATRSGLKLYEGFGFKPAGTVVQHRGAAAQPGPQALPSAMRLRPVSRSDLQAIARLDAAATGADRTALLGALLDVSDGVVLENGDRLAGYALVRQFGRGRVIGPVIAGDEAGARAMIADLLGRHTGQFMRVDVPDHSGIGAWLGELGLADAGSVIRMDRGAGAPATGAFRTFGLASQAFG